MHAASTTTKTKSCARCGGVFPNHHYYFPNNRGSCRECVREYHTAWRKQHPERVAQYAQKARESDIERVRRYGREWGRRNRDYCRANRLNSLARKYGVDGTITKDDVARRLNELQGRCAYCASDLSDRYDVDHVIPMSRGGANTIENITVCCHACNASKGNKLLSEWERE